MKKILSIMLLIGAALLCSHYAFAHCEIPCGIYDDQARIDMIAEHITTIEKSMNEIQALSKDDAKNYNQIVRWVMNKDKHAEELQHIVWQYFMAQRIKPVFPDDKEAFAKYQKELTLLHQLSVYAMKAKQETDVAVVEKLRELLAAFKESYMGS